MIDHNFPVSKKLTDTELIEVFPEARQIIPVVLKEKVQQRVKLVKDIKAEHERINANPDEMFRYVGNSWLKLTLVEDLWIVDKQISRLSRQLRLIKGKTSKAGQLAQEMIDTARDVPVENLLDQQFRRSGKDLVGLCIFHSEKTPSFHIYTDQNRGWCFGCNQGGDAIAITMLINNCSFKEAVMSLTEGKV